MQTNLAQALQETPCSPLSARCFMQLENYGVKRFISVFSCHNFMWENISLYAQTHTPLKLLEPPDINGFYFYLPICSESRKRWLLDYSFSSTFCFITLTFFIQICSDNSSFISPGSAKGPHQNFIWRSDILNNGLKVCRLNNHSQSDFILFHFQAEGENEVNNELANRISLFYADATPMLKALSDGTTKFVSEVSGQ